MAFHVLPNHRPFVAELLVNQFVYLENGTTFDAQARFAASLQCCGVLRDYTHAKNAVGNHRAQSRTELRAESGDGS